MPDYASHDAVQAFLEQESGHVMESHLQYFSHWLLLCSLEAVTMETKNGRKRVWLQTAEERWGTIHTHTHYTNKTLCFENTLATFLF